MDTDTFGNRDESEDRVTRLRITALREVIIHILHIHIHFDGQSLQFRTIDILRMFPRQGRLLFRFEQHITQALDIFLTVRDGLIHIRDGFVTQAGSHLGDIGFGIIDLPVLELPVDDLLTFRGLFVLDLFERLTNLTLGFG